jgi:ATP/maltotriose-dependent transcriptional regulator MalT
VGGVANQGDRTAVPGRDGRDVMDGECADIARWRAAGESSLAAWGIYYFGQVQRAQGHLGAALGTYQQALAMAAEPGGPALLAAAPAHAGMAEVAYQRDKLEAALRHATEGIALYRQLGYELPLVTALATLARIRQAQGDRTGALAAIAEAERVGLSPALVGLLNPVPALRARLALAHGDVAEAARWVQERGLGPDDEPGYPDEREYLALGRCCSPNTPPTGRLRCWSGCTAWR